MKVMAEEMEKRIRRRTLSGRFAAKGSSGTRARRYNRDYARRVGKPAAGPVDLTLSGGMLRNMTGAYTFRRDQGSMGRAADSMEVFIRFKGARAQRLFDIHQNRGAGRGRIKRVFVYLTARDRKEILRRGVLALLGKR